MKNSKWTLYFANRHAVTGKTRADWDKAPESGVQALVLWEKPALEERRWRLVDDRQIWTGQDEYSINGWPSKLGTLVPNKQYKRIARRAFYGRRRD